MMIRTTIIEANCIGEIQFQAENQYDNPFLDVTLDIEFTNPTGEKILVPAFWIGTNQWAVRYASSITGTHRYLTICSVKGDNGLNNITGEVKINHYSGNNPLYKHGPIRVAADRRHFEHNDGKPFLWLADTWWKGLSGRLTWEGFQELCVDRKAKGFNVIQIVCGPYPDEAAFDPGWANEGGMPYENREFTLINPEYFNYADRRLVLLLDTGLMPVLVGAWGRSDCDAMQVAGIEGIKRHWRYLIARFGAYPLIWIPGGEIDGRAKWGEGSWGEVFKYIKIIDPYRRLIASHESGDFKSGKKPLNDFKMVGGSHIDPTGAATLAIFTKGYQEKPVMPILCGETGYEGHMQRAFEDVQRYVFWMYMLNGAAGHTYGAAGMHNMGVEGDPGLNPIWDYTTWQQAKEFNGAVQVGRGKRILEEYAWQRFEPHPEWSDPDCFSAGIPEEVRTIYRPNRSVYDWSGPRLKNLEEGFLYKAFYFDPGTGRRFNLKTIKRVADIPRPTYAHSSDLLFEEPLQVSEDGLWQRIGEPTRQMMPTAGVATAKDKICATNMVYILKTVIEKDVLVSVDTCSHTEVGIVLRFQDLNNYLVALYSPLIKAIYFFDRQNGAWAPFFSYSIPHLGIVDVPEIGQSIKLSAAVSGEYAALLVEDGERKYCSPAVKIENLKSGRVGLWRTNIGEAQMYTNFKASKSKFTPLVTEHEENCHIIRNGNDIAPPVPSPQDWVLVLERTEGK